MAACAGSMLKTRHAITASKTPILFFIKQSFPFRFREYKWHCNINVTICKYLGLKWNRMVIILKKIQDMDTIRRRQTMFRPAGIFICLRENDFIIFLELRKALLYVNDMPTGI